MKSHDSGSPVMASLLVAFVCSVLGAYYFYLRGMRAFPPGPRGIPFLGAAFSMPKEKEWLTFTQWSKAYGSIIGFNVAGQNIVILNTSELATELLGTRGAIYSDRPRIPMLEMVGITDKSVGLMPYGERLRLSRKLLLQAMTPQHFKQYAQIQQGEVYRLLNDLLDSPASFYKHLMRTSGGIMMLLFLGHKVKSGDDKYMALNEELLATTTRFASYAENLVNSLPALRYMPSWFPGAGFRRAIEEARILSQKVFDLPMQLAKQRIEDGTVVPCFMNSVLENGENIDEGQAMAATAYTAGSETTTSTLATFVLAMTLHPDVQKKAQAEVAQAIGSHRLPRYEDRETLHLPFVEAVIKETHRWHSPGPLALPHRLMQDDQVQGYLIPRGTIVLSNLWAILHDETRYHRPYEFYPERYMDNKELEDPREHVFGYGRRICPGRNLANATVWLAIVSILSSFDITPDIDEQGNEIPVIVDYTSGVMIRPKDFRCRITPRHEAVADHIKQALESLEN